MSNPGKKILEIEDFSELEGVCWPDLWEGEYHKQAVKAVEAARNGRTGRFQGFRTTIKGTPKWWDVLVAPVYSPEGKVERLVSVSRDITNLKELEKQKDEFIGIASHELKTPITSIKGFIQIIQRQFKEESYEMAGNFLEKANLHVEKLTGLINDLLDVSKIQAGKLHYNFSEFAIKEIIEDAVEQVSHQANRHQIITEGDMDIRIFGDHLRLEQVISNLLSNAIKYSPEADKVILKVGKEKGSLKVSVTDFGIGIPQERLPEVFDRFFRVEQTSGQFQGLGLGLYICAEIIRRHEGSIHVESTEGKGSIFYFFIPLREKSIN